MALQFEWSSDKAESNLAKNGISFEQAATVFGDEDSLTIDDPKHPREERRLITIGRSHSVGILVIVHTERGDTIRIISARPANLKERRQYEEGQ